MEGKAHSVAHSPEKQGTAVLGFAKKILLAIKPSIASSTRKTRGWYTLLAFEATAFRQRRGRPLKERRRTVGSDTNLPFLGDLRFWVRAPQSELGKGMVNGS
jgi:hypothetical protein